VLLSARCDAQAQSEPASSKVAQSFGILLFKAVCEKPERSLGTSHLFGPISPLFFAFLIREGIPQAAAVGRSVDHHHRLTAAPAECLAQPMPEEWIMPTLFTHHFKWTVVLLTIVSMAEAQDLHIKKSITVGGNFVSSSDTSIKGARERTLTQGANGSTITLRQCDLKRTLTLNEQAQTYFVTNDPQDENAAKAAALATGAPTAEASGGKILVTTTITDTGERKTMYGYPARHLKAMVSEEPSSEACTQVRQSFEIDGWFADLTKEQSSCLSLVPPIQQGIGCNDRVISRRPGTGKPGYPLQESITMPASDGSKTTVGIQISELNKEKLPAELFDVPAGYRQVKSLAELNGAAPTTSTGAQTAQAMTSPTQQAIPQGMTQGTPAMNGGLRPNVPQVMGGPNAAMAIQVSALAQAQQMAMGQSAYLSPGSGGTPHISGMPQMMGGNQATGAQVASPQPLGPKAPGKIRIGVASPDAQVGQGNNAGADYSTPIRNAEIALMSGPAIEITALDARVPMQLQAEAQQKQCDYILFSGVTVKHSSGGFGKFAKFGGMAASMTPMAGMGRGMGGAIAAQTASMAASQMAQQQAMNQLANFNGQIKSKDDVTVQYQLVATGQTSPLLQNSLQGKAKSDGEDVLTPLLQQVANNVLGQVSKK
jgi:hypothetical protein